MADKKIQGINVETTKNEINVELDLTNENMKGLNKDLENVMVEAHNEETSADIIFDVLQSHGVTIG